MPRGSAGASPSLQTPSGAALFEDLGCVACHRTTAPGEVDRYERLPLAHLAAKFRPGALASFLRRPHEHFATTRMPDFANCWASLPAQEALWLEAPTPSAVDDPRITTVRLRTSGAGVRRILKA